MLRCPICGIEIDDTTLLDGRCPQCGGIVTWNEDVEGADEGPDDLDDGPPPDARLDDDSRATTSGRKGRSDTKIAPRDDAPRRGDTVRKSSADANPQRPTVAAPVDPNSKTRVPAVRATLPEGAPADRAGRPPIDRQILATITPRDLSDDQLRTMNRMWQNSATDRSRPELTIKSSSSATVTVASLVIQPRAVRRKSETHETGTADYELLDMVGEGGVGVVFSARQASIDRVVAVKMLKPEITGDLSHRDKFLSEAVVTGELDHPNIVPIYDLGSNNEGDLFYSMKLVRGTPWSAVMRDRSLPENLSILLKVADAVAFAHAHGVVHRDLKPENVMLGDFGEVLVMDWGIALSTSLHTKSEEIRKSACMGGTPAYMAPEMATGPIEEITALSDVYLLGAILFEMTTEMPPHDGPTVMDCLRAAARNEIQETDQTGELVEIAYRAMATDPKDRYASVPDFQAAIREYQSHSESIALAFRAEEDLKAAEATQDYQLYARTMFAYQEALALWPENSKAKTGLGTATLSYAHCASVKGDYDLGLSLLDENSPLHRPLRKQMEDALHEREARQDRLKRIRQTVRGLAMLMFLVVTSFSIFVAMQRRELQKSYVKLQQSEGQLMTKTEDLQERTDELSQEKARLQQSQDELQEQAVKLEKSRNVAVQARQVAVDARESAIASREDARYESYLAQIGLASAKIKENAFRVAVNILDNYQDSPLRHWEWGRLRYIKRLSEETFDGAEEVDCVAAWGDGRRLAVGRRGGTVRVRSRKEVEEDAVSVSAAESSSSTVAQWDELTLDTGSRTVLDMEFSPDGRYLLTASDAAISLVLWDLNSGKPVDGWFAGDEAHRQPVLSVRYSNDGKLILTGSVDGSARIWSAEDGGWINTLERHHDAVRDVAISPDGRTIVSVSDDGTAVVWKDDDGDWSDIAWTDELGGRAQEKLAPRFTGHTGPINAVEFSPDGRHVATAGVDKLILIWNPRNLKVFPYAKVLDGLENGESVEVQEQQALALRGHRAAVRSLAFAPDDPTVLLSGGSDNTINVWNTVTGEIRKSLRGHSREVSRCVFVSSNEGDRIVFSGSQDGSARIWYVNQYDEQIVLDAQVLSGHDDAVMHGAFDPREEGVIRVVTAGREGVSRVWSLRPERRDGRPECQTLHEGHEFLIADAVFLPDGIGLLTAAMDNSVRVWDRRTGAQRIVVRGTGQRVAISVSGDGRWLLTGSDEGDAQLFDLAAMRQEGAARPPVRRLPQGESVTVTASAVSAPVDGNRWLITGDDSGNCLLWSLGESAASDDAPVAEMRQRFAHADSMVAARFLPSGRRAVTASRDGTVRLWEVPDMTSVHVMQGPDAVMDLAVSSGGDVLVASYADGSVIVWDVEQGNETNRLGRIVGGPQTVAGNLRRRMSRNGLTAEILQQQADIPAGALAGIRGGRGGNAIDPEVMKRLAAALDTTVEAMFQPLATAVNLSADGKHVACTYTEDGTVRVWNLETGTQVPADSGSIGRGLAWDPQRVQGAVSAAVFSEDSKYLAVVGGQSARLWNLSAGAVRMTFAPHQAMSFSSFSHDGGYVVTAGWDSVAKIWDTRTGQVVTKLLNGHVGIVNSAVFSPDDKLVLTAGEDGRAILWNWDPASTDPPSRRVLTTRDTAIRVAGFSEHGERIVTACADGQAQVWDAGTGKPVAELKDELSPSPILSAVFSRDGRWLLTGNQDQRARLWDVARGRVVAVMEGHTAQVGAVAFSPDGRRVLTGSGDQTIKLWDTRRATAAGVERVALQEILTLSGHREEVTSVSFSPSGRFVLSSSRDATAILWPSVHIAPNIYLSAEDQSDASATDWKQVDETARMIAPNTGSFAGDTLTVELEDENEFSWQLRFLASTGDSAGLDQASMYPTLGLGEDGELTCRYVGETDAVVLGKLETDRNGRSLRFRFNARATVGMIQQLLRQMQYRYLSSPDVDATTRVRVVLSSGDNRQLAQAVKLVRHSAPLPTAGTDLAGLRDSKHGLER